MNWLLLFSLIGCTIIFAVFYLRLRQNRFIHKIYLHSFFLLSYSYIAMYLECVCSVLAACYIFYDHASLSADSIYFLGAMFISISSSNFASRVLREYRIFISTYIEKGLLGYDTTISKKRRLKTSWNVMVGAIYVVSSTFIIFTAAFLHREIYHGENAYGFLEGMILVIKSYEITMDIYFFWRFMNSNIQLGYRMESLIFISCQMFLVLFVSINGIVMYLTYGVAAMQKLFSVTFFDSYILCLLTKDSDKKPLLPPIFMIDSSFYITEIKLVYDAFAKFIEKSGNKEWKILTNLLMEIQMGKLNDPGAIKESCMESIQKVKSIKSKISEKILEVAEESDDGTINKIEVIIIEALDSDAFKVFMNSKEFQELHLEFSSTAKSLSCIT